MTLLKIIDNHVSPMIMWNYYPSMGLLAYMDRIGTHGCIHEEIEKRFGSQQGKIISGIVSRSTSYIFVHCSREELTKEQKRSLFRNLSDLIDIEKIKNESGFVTFAYDPGPGDQLQETEPKDN